MKNLMLSTAIAAGLIAATGVSAVAQNASSPMFRDRADPMELRASNFIGMRVYRSETAVSADETAGLQADWDDIGEINDVVLSRDGGVEAVLVDIGGFLGMGERQVAVDMGAINFVSDGATTDRNDDFFLVMNAARTDFETAPEYSMTPVDGVADDTTATDTTAAAPATDMTGTAATDTTTDTAAATDPTAGTMAREPIARDGFTVAATEELTTEKLTGARVYDANDDWIGDVGALVMTDAGQITDAVIDVGGFLGMGEKPVALKLADIDILRSAEGDEVRVYVSMTKEQLEQLPTYDR